MNTKPFLIAAFLAAFALPAFAPSSFAQAPQGTPTNIRGTITKISGQTLTVKTREGASVNVALAPTTGVRTLVKKKLSDIKTGDNVASTSIPGKDGKLHAIELHFLPAAVPESQSPYDLKPGSLMTNAHVNGIATAKSGGTLTVTFQGKTTDVVVDSKTKIVGPADGAMSDLKAGKAVFVRATKAADGSLSSSNVTVEKGGVKPPM